MGLQDGLRGDPPCHPPSARPFRARPHRARLHRARPFRERPFRARLFRAAPAPRAPVGLNPARWRASSRARPVGAACQRRGCAWPAPAAPAPATPWPWPPPPSTRAAAAAVRGTSQCQTAAAQHPAPYAAAPAPWQAWTPTRRPDPTGGRKAGRPPAPRGPLAPASRLGRLSQHLHLGHRQPQPAALPHGSHQLRRLRVAGEEHRGPVAPLPVGLDAGLQHRNLVERQIQLVLPPGQKPRHVSHRARVHAGTDCQRHRHRRLPLGRLPQPSPHQCRFVGTQPQLCCLRQQPGGFYFGHLGRGASARRGAAEQVRVHPPHPPLARRDAGAQRRHFWRLKPERLGLLLQLLQFTHVRLGQGGGRGGGEPGLALGQAGAKAAHLGQGETRPRRLGLGQRGPHLADGGCRAQHRRISSVPHNGRPMLGSQLIEAPEYRLQPCGLGSSLSTTPAAVGRTAHVQNGGVYL
eukprot:scaffold27437_cov96-Isochrysis_galbana.AAC.1